MFVYVQITDKVQSVTVSASGHGVAILQVNSFCLLIVLLLLIFKCFFNFICTTGYGVDMLLQVSVKYNVPQVSNRPAVNLNLTSWTESERTYGIRVCTRWVVWSLLTVIFP